MKIRPHHLEDFVVGHDQDPLADMAMLDSAESGSGPGPEPGVGFHAGGLDHVPKIVQHDCSGGVFRNVRGRLSGENSIIPLDEVRIHMKFGDTQPLGNY